MGTLTAVGLLPHLLFSLPAGVWLDRVRPRRRLMIAADLGRAALIASIPVAYALGRPGDAPALRRRLPERDRWRSSSTCRGTRCSCRSPSASATSRRWPCSTAAGRSPRSAARRSAGSSSRSSARRWRCSATRCRSSARSSSCAGSASPEPPIEHEEGSTRERLLAGLSFVLGDPIMRPTLLVGRDDQPVHVRRRARCSSCMRRRPSASRRAPSASRSGPAAVGAVIGAIFASRIGRRIGLGPAYALGLRASSRCRSCSSRWPGRRCRCR